MVGSVGVVGGGTDGGWKTNVLPDEPGVNVVDGIDPHPVPTVYVPAAIDPAVADGVDAAETKVAVDAELVMDVGFRRIPRGRKDGSIGMLPGPAARFRTSSAMRFA